MSAADVSLYSSLRLTTAAMSVPPPVCCSLSTRGIDRMIPVARGTATIGGCTLGSIMRVPRRRFAMPTLPRPARRRPVRLDRRRAAPAPRDWIYTLSPTEIGEIEAATPRCAPAGSTSPRSPAPISRCRPSARCSTGCAARCSTAAASCCCAGCRSRAGRSPTAPPPIGASAAISAMPARRTRWGICSAMSAISASRRPTPTCAPTRPPSASISTPTRATSSGCSASRPRNRAGCRRSSARWRSTT